MNAQTTDLPNLELLIKLLKMTTSAHDHEALLAMRKANEQIKKVGGDWDTLLRGKVKIFEDPFKSIDVPDQEPRRAPRPPTPPAPPRPAAPPPPPKAPSWAKPQTAPPPNRPANTYTCSGCGGDVITGTSCARCFPQKRPKPKVTTKRFKPGTVQLDDLID